MLEIERRKRKNKKKKECCSINSIQNEQFQRDPDQYELNAMQNEVRNVKTNQRKSEFRICNLFYNITLPGHTGSSISMVFWLKIIFLYLHMCTECTECTERTEFT